MRTSLTAADLIAFEEKVKRAFLDKQIRAPIHLCSETQAEPLIEIFKDIKEDDWVFGTWRSHFHCLLKGVPEAELFQAILDGRSMYLMFKQQRVFCSAIVGGILPVALGVAMSIKRAGGKERVYCFIGDCTARTGLFREFVQYSGGHGLPIYCVIEDNGYSTNAPTKKTWGEESSGINIKRYEYNRTFPHVGIGQKVSF